MQVPLENVLTDDVSDDGQAYELAHMLSIGADNLTSLNASVIHIAVSKAGNTAVRCGGGGLGKGAFVYSCNGYGESVSA